VAIDLGHPVGRTGIKGCSLGLRHFLHLPEHLARGRLVEADPGVHDPDGLEDVGDAEGGDVRGQDRLLPGGGDEGHRRQVVDLVRLGQIQDPDERGQIDEVAVDDRQPIEEVLDPLHPLGAGAADHPMDDVPLRQEKFGQVRAVLSGDAGDESGFHGRT
jgi:hypothetical protein